ncbi:PfkB domain protein [Sinomonas atrocyanea]|uniref:PfkB domain protein n=1 Tax=Sinomonas atrocyanea TaxID=37927 RepID=A0A127A410_9MICC|nr:PfkB family carbohydrate kinase [Sinomonas atrocyanea]AMM33524.1 PfkB domain protein [Sinomonas atrocyanea]GEB62964.1 ribokinase [Sinomonas atrocyanea]GGG61889.1 ribokinase [Sinomonas atrocyanea]
MNVLVIGESLVDIIHAPSGTEEHPGGSPANVALGLARLGVRTSFLTALGTDRRGQAVADHLAGAGVAVLAESWSAPATSTASAYIADDGAARYAFDLAWALPADIRLPVADHVHIGSVAAFLAPGAQRVEEIVRALPAGATVSFDPNIRPGLVGDQREAQERFERLAALADIVKLSDDDAGFLYPGLPAREALGTIAALGPRVVALTAGAAGSLLASPRGTADAAAVPATVADTVGAGDSFMAALLFALLGPGRPLLDTLSDAALASAGAFAARAAAITVSRTGAEPPLLAEMAAGSVSPSHTLLQN